ncbi:YceD family protein [Haloimpatiens sp. FM7330]|uniref:YceD family protein n=1 Tax=Haloimpatiens sp. FM7330 TaxID=3298610 RepID=UPI003634FC33
MKIDISDLLKRKITKQHLELNFQEENLNVGGEVIEFSKPVNLDITLRNLENVITLNGNLKAEVILTCSRCLEKFNFTVEVELNEKISNNQENKDDDVIFIHNSKLDLNDIVCTNIIMALPIKRLCKEDCKGLCQVCGANLNYSQCDCDKEDIDPRLAKLKDFF